MNTKVLLAVFKRNFVSYFANPTGYVFITVFVWLCVFAGFWPDEFFNANLANLGYLNRYFPFIMLVFIPAIAMSIWADERRQGTDELLLTAPVTPGQIVAAKWLGLMAVAGGMLGSTLVFTTILGAYGDPERGPIVTGLLGLVLVVAALTSLGLAVSTLTESQVMAAVASFVLFLGLFVVEWPADAAQGWVRSVLVGLSLPARYQGFAKGLVASPDVAYFLSLTALGWFAARAAIASQRWR